MKTLLSATLVVAALAAPSSALAASAQVTGDGGAPVPLGGPVTIRHMSPEVGLLFEPTEKRYSLDVLGPTGAAATNGATTCQGTGFPFPERVRYQGNGTYTVIARTWSGEDDFQCEGAPQEQRFTFVINAFTAVLAPAATLLTRQPGSFSTIAHAFRADVNPGADRHELRYAAGGAIGPDGGISGPAETATVNSSTGAATLYFSRPGRYTFVARASVFNGAGDAFTAWSGPVPVTVLAPFDLSSTSFPDSRGPRYRLAAQIRESTATGRVRVAVARGRRGGKFRRLGTARIRRAGRFSLRFRLRRTGTYRLRYSFAGSPTVAPGRATEVIRIRRRVFFR